MASVKQRFQSLKSHINTELCSILAAYPEETEQVANEIGSLASYVKDSNAITQSVLVARIAKNGQDVNAHVEPTATTADNFSDSCQANGERVAQDEVSAPSIHSNDARSGRRSDENGQNMESPIHNLSQICDEILATENQDLVEAASERISMGTERKNIEEELTGQDVREKGEGGAASADGASEEQDSEPESEEEPQAQNIYDATKLLIIFYNQKTAR